MSNKTNIYNLPKRVLSVIEGCNPERGRPSKKIVHVTQLQTPPYAWNLYRNKWDEIVKDYSDQLLIAQGSSLHECYEKYLPEQGWECEVHFEKEIDGVILTGTCDAFNPTTEILIDLKQTSVWGPSYKIDDYTKQTNCYAWFLQKRGMAVDKIYIDVWYRNWALKQSGYSKDYPKIPFETIEIPVWGVQRTENYIKQQLEYLTMCKDECSREDRWQKYSIMKNKNKTPSRNTTTVEEANLWIDKYHKENPTKKDKFTIVDSPPLNCLTYCNARSVCDYALSLRKK